MLRIKNVMKNKLRVSQSCKKNSYSFCIITFRKFMFVCVPKDENKEKSINIF